VKREAAYIRAGPETGKRVDFVRELRDSLTASDGAPPEEHRLYASETSVPELLSVLRNGSLFAARRLVEYRGAELIKGKEDVGAVAAYLGAPAPDAVLLLVTDQYYLEKGLEEAAGKDRKRTFYEMFESEKPRWISKRLGELGLGIDADGITALLELVENESAALESACERLALVFPRGASLGESEVEAAIARNRQEDAFGLFERIASGELGEALDALDAVLSDRRGDAVQIVSAIIWSFRRLQKLHLALEEGERLESACLKLQVRSKSLQRQLAAAARRFGKADCERAVAFAGSIDARARAMGSAYERILLQLLVYGLVSRKGDLSLSEQAFGPQA